MKKIHIIILVLIAVSIGVLMSLMGNLSTYDTIASAQKKQGTFVHLIAKLDKTHPMEYDPIKNPNYLSFYAVDSLGGFTKVVYHNPKPADLEKTERVVLKGKMEGNVFECREILLKCPSKYKDDAKQVQQQLNAKL